MLTIQTKYPLKQTEKRYKYFRALWGIQIHFYNKTLITPRAQKCLKAENRKRGQASRKVVKEICNLGGLTQ